MFFSRTLCLLAAGMLFLSGPGIPVSAADSVRIENGLSVPSDFPEFEVHAAGETASGYLFTGCAGYLMILDNAGAPVYYHRYPDGRHDFQQQRNGAFSFVKGGCWDSRFYLMNDQYAVTETLLLGDGRMTGGHEVIVLPNGHRLFIELKTESRDMSGLVSGGDPNALLQTESVVETDADGETVFTWNASDHYDILDMGDEIGLTEMVIEYGHINSMAIDYDNQLVLSNRHFCEITKIDRTTGEVIWRLGGKNNAFTWVNEETPFLYQHCIRPVSGHPDHYLLFDNGNGREPAYSRAVEYRLDPVGMTAEKVWEYRREPDVFFRAQGSVQRLPNGNTLIGWGLSFSEAHHILCTEVTPDNEVVFEMRGPEASRVHRYDWSGQAAVPYLLTEPQSDHLLLLFNQFGATGIDHYRIYGSTGMDAPKRIKTAVQPWARLLPADLDTHHVYWYFRVTSVDSAGRESAYSNNSARYVQFPDADQNLVFNGGFSQRDAGWDLGTTHAARAAGNVVSERYEIQISEAGGEIGDVQLSQKHLVLNHDRTYQLSFDAFADSRMMMETHIGPYFAGTQRLTPDSTHFVYTVTADQPDAFDCVLSFHCGLKPGVITLDNIRLVKTETTECADRTGPVPGLFGLTRCFPNPFNAVTQIQYRVAKSAMVRLSVCDVRGRRVAVLVHRYQQAGTYRVPWHAGSTAGGLYFVRLEAGAGFTDTRKLILQK